MSRRSRDNEASDFELARDERRMQRTRAAIGNDGKIAYVESTLGGDAFDHICHLCNGDAYDAVCGCDHVEAERACDFVQDLSLIHISEPTRRTPISYAVF